MNESQLAAYHLNVQTTEIAEMKARTQPFATTLAGIDITVLPKVYPGGIDSELMCEVIGDLHGESVLDICTGTGIVAIAAAQRGAAEVVAVDLNPAAVQNAELNKRKLELQNLTVFEGSLFEPIGNKTFDIIAINPPYTGKKPADKTEICFWDEDNHTTRLFFEQYKDHLAPGGAAYLGWADFSSLELIEEFAARNSVRLEKVAARSTRSGLATFLIYRLVAFD